MHKTRILSLVIALMTLCSLGGAQAYSFEQRLEQAGQYLAQQKYEEALFALELAEAMRGPTKELYMLRLQAYQALGNNDEVLAMLDELIRLEPANPILYLEKASMQSAAGDPAAARAALMRAVVASGGDEAFSARYAAAFAPMLWQLASYTAEERDYEGAARLFAYHPPEPGSYPAYDQVQRILNGEVLPTSVHPGITSEQFQRLIAQDGLKLSPANLNLEISIQNLYEETDRYVQALKALGVEPPHINPLPEGAPDLYQLDMDTFYQSVSYYSLSPDAKKLFMIAEDVPLVLDLQTQRVRAIVPGPIMSAEYCARYYRKLANAVEDRALRWSEDSSWISISFPEQTLLKGLMGMNTVVMDLVKGEAGLLDPTLPINASFSTLKTPITFPVRAAFDPLKPLLHYEIFGTDAAGELTAELRSYDLNSGEVIPIARTDARSVTANPALWVTSEGILKAYVSVEATGDRGIAFYGFDGSRSPLAVNRDRPEQAAIQRAQLASFAANQGVVYTNRGYDAKTMIPHAFQLFQIGDDANSVYGRALAIDPEKPAGERMIYLDMRDVYGEGAQDSEHERPTDPKLQSGLLLPNSAVLSPDGRYLLLATGREEPALFVLDIEHWVLGRVQVDGAQLYDGRPFAHEGVRVKNDLPGLRWLNHNRIMIRHGDQMRVYELDSAI